MVFFKLCLEVMKGSLIIVVFVKWGGLEDFG